MYQDTTKASKNMKISRKNKWGNIEKSKHKIKNLFYYKLNDKKISVLKFSLEQGVWVTPKEIKMVVIMENIHDKIKQNDLINKYNKYI